MKSMMLRGLLALALPLGLVGGAIAAEKIADRPHSDPRAMCAEMIRKSRPEGLKAMEEFMEMMGSMGGGMSGGQGGLMQRRSGQLR
jgi:hypothetical protein